MSANGEADEAMEVEAAIETSHHRLVLLPGTEPLLRSLDADARAAKRRAMIETYIFKDDKMGQLFAETLANPAERGVPTRLLYDPLGSQETPDAFFEALRARGIETRPYRPADVAFATGSFWPRDHSRVFVFDDAAYTGGAAWADPWLPRCRGGEGWHDVSVRVEGPAVKDFVAVFEQRWKEATGEIAKPRDFATDQRHPDLELVADSPVGAPLVHERHLAAIRRARERIWIENAYFFPPPDLLEALYAAVARGVDVRVILPRESDLSILKRAARAEVEAWLDHGILVFEYMPCMVHSKYAVIDDAWCTIGTYNINPTSLGMVNEVNLFVFDRRFVDRVARLFLDDLSKCKPLSRLSLEARPLGEVIIDRLANDAINIVDLLLRPRGVS